MRLSCRWEDLRIAMCSYQLETMQPLTLKVLFHCWAWFTQIDSFDPVCVLKNYFKDKIYFAKIKASASDS